VSLINTNIDIDINTNTNNRHYSCPAVRVTPVRGACRQWPQEERQSLVSASIKIQRALQRDLNMAFVFTQPSRCEKSYVEV
jgi:hypothetical protein